MKTKLSLLLLIFFVVNSTRTRAQTNVYHPFPDSNAIWKVSILEYCSSMNSWINGDDQYSLNGDTIISNIKYKKVYRQGISSCNNAPYKRRYFGCYRNSNKTVYTNVSGKDTLMYDFTMQIGDTLKGVLQPPKGCLPLIVDSIDSVQVFNTYRKRIWLKNTDCIVISNLQYILEGIGSTNGLFEKIYDTEVGRNIAICFRQNNIIGYKFIWNSDCDILDINTKPIAIPRITISPNPVTSQSIIELAGLSLNNNAMLLLYNTFGQLVQSILINEGNGIINKSNLPNGLYYYQILQNNQPITYGKIILQ